MDSAISTDKKLSRYDALEVKEKSAKENKNEEDGREANSNN